MEKAELVIKSLTSLQSQCKGTLASFDHATDNAQVTVIESQIEKIVSGIENAEMLSEFMCYVNVMDNEKQKMRLQIKRLIAENNWLRNEVADVQEKMQKSEQSVADFEEKHKALEYWVSVHKFEQRLARQLSEEELAKNTSIIEVELTKNDNNTAYHVANVVKATIDKRCQKEPPIKSSSSSSDCDISTDSEISEVTENIADGKISLNAPKSKFQNVTKEQSKLKTNNEEKYTTPKAVIRYLHHLALYYSTTKRYDLALPISREALKQMQALYGRQHLDVASMLTIQAVLYNETCLYAESIELLKEALAIRMQLLGELNPFVMASLNNLAAILNKAGLLDEAEMYSRKALKIRERVHGPMHPDVAKQLSNLSIIYGRAGDNRRAIKACERALKIYENHLNSEHGSVIQINYQLAHYYIKDGQFRKAQRLLIRVVNTLHTLNRVEFDKNPTGIYYDIGNWHLVDQFKVPSLWNASIMLCHVYRMQGNDKSATGIEHWVNKRVIKVPNNENLF